VAELNDFSAYLDEKIGGRIAALAPQDARAELLMLHRTMKAAEEVGESIAAVIGMTGANPRKGEVGNREDLVNELLDVAVSALGAVEHLNGNDGSSLDLLRARIDRVVARAGLNPQPAGAQP